MEQVNKNGEALQRNKIQSWQAYSAITKNLGLKPREIDLIDVINEEIHIQLKNGIEVLKRFKNIQNLFPMGSTNLDSEKLLEDKFLKIKNLDKFREDSGINTKKVRILKLGRKVPLEHVKTWFNKFGKVLSLKPINPDLPKGLDEERKLFFSNFPTMDFEVEFIPNGIELPSILPINGKKITIASPLNKRQCPNCFEKGHNKKECKANQVPLKTYKKNLIAKVKGSTTVPKQQKGPEMEARGDKTPKKPEANGSSYTMPKTVTEKNTISTSNRFDVISNLQEDEKSPQTKSSQTRK